MDLVAKMRQAQREYFQTRDRMVLQRVKELEREVDSAVPRMRSPGMFEWSSSKDEEQTY